MSAAARNVVNGAAEEKLGFRHPRGNSEGKGSRERERIRERERGRSGRRAYPPGVAAATGSEDEAGERPAGSLQREEDEDQMFLLPAP